jgi:CheY-like chemotaxis protein
LLVEDDGVSRHLVETILEPHGYDLHFAGNGPKAIELACDRLPDLILMDLNLPGMNGCETIEVLKSRPETAEIPVVALTAHAAGDERRRAMEAGCEGYMVKPIDTRSFAQRLRQFMQ